MSMVWIFLVVLLLDACLIFPALACAARADDLAGER